MWIVTMHLGKFVFNREAYVISFSHIPIKNTTTFFLVLKLILPPRQKVAPSSQVRIVFLHTIAICLKCCSYSYRKPKTIRWKKKHWNLLESTYKHKHCNEVSRYFISVCSKGNTDESVKVKIRLWPNPLISELGRLRQEDWYEVRASLSYRVSPCLKHKQEDNLHTNRLENSGI